MDNKAIAERDQRRDAPVQGALPWPIVVSVRAMLKLPMACRSRSAGLEEDWVSARTADDRQTSASTGAKSMTTRCYLRMSGTSAVLVTSGLRCADAEAAGRPDDQSLARLPDSSLQPGWPHAATLYQPLQSPYKFNGSPKNNKAPSCERG